MKLAFRKKKKQAAPSMNRCAACRAGTDCANCPEYKRQRSAEYIRSKFREIK